MKTLILWIDAINKNFITEETMPFLSNLVEKYGVGELKQSFGYTSIAASFYTGLHPNKHNQFTLYKRGRSGLLKVLPKKIASFLSQKRYYRENSLGVKSIFDYLRENNLRFLYYNWPIIVSDKIRLSFNRNNDKSKVDKFLKLCKRDYDIYFLHLWDMDKCGHKYGTNSLNYKLKLREQDYLIKKVLSKFDLENDNIVIWSDHGMVNVNKTLDLESQLPNKKGYSYFLDSTMGRFWFENEKIKEEILDILKKVEDGHLLTEKEKKDWHIDLLKGYGDKIFLVNPGVIIIPNFFQNNMARGMHGYNLSNKNELGIFIINKKVKNKGEMVDLLPTILDLIKIKYNKLDGKSLLK